MAGVTTYYQTGVHGSRPANGSGCVLYSCTTHNLVYRDDGTSWTTFITLPGAGMTNPMTTANDLIIGGASGTPARLATVASKVLTTDGSGNISWATGAATGVTRSTLGTTSAGSSFASTRGVYIKKVTMPSDGLLASVHAFIKGNASNGTDLVVGLLSDNAGAPLSVIAVSGTINVESTSGPLINIGLSTTVRDIAVPIGRWLVAGDYWLAVAIHASGSSIISLAFNSASGTDRKFTGVTPVISDQSFNTYGSSDTNDYCIYADVIR